MSSHFSLIDFRLFLNIAATDNLTRGAELSNLSASAASLRIKNLEAGLQVKLLNRKRQGVKLTPAGDVFLRRAQLISDQFDILKTELGDHLASRESLLRIAANHTSISDPLPRVVNDYKRLYPDVRVDLQVEMNSQIVRAVSEGAADIGLIGGDAPLWGVEVLPYMQDRLILAVPQGHPLAARQRLRFAEALPYEMIGHAAGSAAQTFMSRIADASRTPMRISVTVSSHGALCRMVEAGVGIGVISEGIATTYATSMSLRLIPLTDLSAKRDINICVRSLKTAPRYTSLFVKLLQAAAK